MSIVINDPALQSKLTEVAEASLLDSRGKPLGHFVSAELYRALLKQYSESQITREELDRRFHDPNRSTLQEIWTRLEAS